MLMDTTIIGTNHDRTRSLLSELATSSTRVISKPATRMKLMN